MLSSQSWRNWEIWSFYRNFFRATNFCWILTIRVSRLHSDCENALEPFFICFHSINWYDAVSKIWAENLFASSWPWPWCPGCKNLIRKTSATLSTLNWRNDATGLVEKSKHPSISNDMYGIRSFPFSVLSFTIYLLLVFSSIWTLFAVLFCTLSLADINTSDATWK